MAAAGRTMTWFVGVGAWKGEGGSFSCDFADASFPGWPSIRSRRLVDGFLLKPMSACEEVP